MSSTTLYCTLYFQIYNRKRSSFLNSVCAPPGSIVRYVMYWISTSGSKMTNRKANGLKPIKLFSSVEFDTVRFPNIIQQSLWFSVRYSSTEYENFLTALSIVIKNLWSVRDCKYSPFGRKFQKILSNSIEL